MPGTVNHVLTATTPDDPGYEIRPSHWNSSHAVTFNAVGSEISGAFNNAGGVTFGLETNGSITAAAPVGGGGITNINVSAGTTSNNLSRLTFADSNGISFGLNGSVITGTVATNYLTTAALSNHSHGASGSNGSFAFQTLSFSNANGVSFGTSLGNAIIASHNAITTARASNDGVGLNTAQTNVTWTVNSNGISVNAGGYAGTGFTSTTTAGTAIVGTQGTNGLSVGVPAFLTTAQPVGAYLTTARASNDAVGLNTALTAGPLAWTVNSSGISLNAGSAAGTTSGFGGGSISGSMTHNTAGLNLSLSHPAWLTTAMQSNAATISNINLSAGTTSTNASAFTFSNANNVSFGLGTGASVGNITASASFNQTSQSAIKALGASNTGNTAGNTGMSTGVDWVIAGTGALTVSQSTVGGGPNTLWLDAPSAAAGNVTFSAGANSSGLASVIFSNANGVSFGLGAGSVITASANAGGGGIGAGVSTGGNTAGSTGTITTGNLILVGGTNISLSQSTGAAGSNATVTINGPASSSLVAVAPIGLSTNGSTISITVTPESMYSPPWNYSGGASNSSLGQSSLYFMPFDVPFPLYASRVQFFVSMSGALSAGNSTGTCSNGLGYALYSLGTGTASDRLTRITSYSAVIASQSMTSNTAYRATHYIGLSDITSHSTSQVAISSSNATTYLATRINGMRALNLPVNSTLQPGRYWMGVSVQTVTGNAMTNNMSVMHTAVNLFPAVVAWGVNSSASNASVWRAMQGFGTYSAQSAAWPDSIAFTTDNIRHGVSQTMVHFNLLGYATSTNLM